MKKAVVNYLMKQKALLKKQVERRGENALSPEDADNAYALIDEVEATIKEIEAAPEAATFEDVMKAMEAKMAEFAEAMREKANTEPKQQPAENYLHSENSLHDFADSLRDGMRGGSFRSSWGKKLSANGVTITSGDEFGYMPDYVVGRIEDKFLRRYPWLADLKWVNAKRYAIRYQSADQNSTSPDVRAKGHTPGNAKTDNAFTMVAESLECQAIYAKIMIDNITVFNDDKGLIDYVIETLGDQMVYETQRAVLVGDGRLSTSPDKINSIVSVGRATTDAFVTVTSRDSSNYELIEQLREMVDSINNEAGEDVYVFLSKSDITEIAKFIYTSGSAVRYTPIEDIAAMIGATKIFPSALVGADANDFTYQAIAFCPSKYVMIGQQDYKLDTWQDYVNNQAGYRLEKFTAGAPEGLLMGAALLAV